METVRFPTAKESWKACVFVGNYLNIWVHVHVDRRTNQSILEEINDIIGARMRLANEVKTFKLMWFGHVTRHDVFSKPFLQGSTPGSRPRGRPATSLISNIKSWTGPPLHALSHAAYDRVGFRDIIHNSLADSCRNDHLVIMSYTYIHTNIHTCNGPFTLRPIRGVRNVFVRIAIARFPFLCKRFKTICRSRVRFEGKAFGVRSASFRFVSV